MQEGFIGIDVSKDGLDVATYPAGFSGHFSNTDAGINDLVMTFPPKTAKS